MNKKYTLTLLILGFIALLTPGTIAQITESIYKGKVCLEISPKTNLNTLSETFSDVIKGSSTTLRAKKCFKINNEFNIPDGSSSLNHTVRAYAPEVGVADPGMHLFSIGLGMVNSESIRKNRFNKYDNPEGLRLAFAPEADPGNPFLGFSSLTMINLNIEKAKSKEVYYNGGSASISRGTKKYLLSGKLDETTFSTMSGDYVVKGRFRLKALFPPLPSR